MLVIRLLKTGKKNAPSYRVVLTEKTNAPQSGKFLEVLGSYSPGRTALVLNKERIKYWLGQGAQASDTVHNLLVTAGVIKAGKRKKFGRKARKKEGEVAKKPKETKITKKAADADSEKPKAEQPAGEKKPAADETVQAETKESSQGVDKEPLKEVK